MKDEGVVLVLVVVLVPRARARARPRGREAAGPPRLQYPPLAPSLHHHQHLP